MTSPKNMTIAVVVVAAVGLLAAAKLGGLGDRWWGREDLPASAPLVVVPAPPVDVPILVYHNVRPTPVRRLSANDAQYEVTPGEFAAQMSYLKEGGFTPVSFAALAAQLARPDATWPAKPVIISFDDGRRSQLENALPILDRYGFHATFFIFTNAPDRNPNYFTWDEIKKLEAAGHEIGSHTRLHQYLTKADDARLATELSGAQDDFEKKLGHRVSAVSYPFGLADDRVRAATVKAGYSLGRALHHQITVSPADLLDLPAYIVTGNLKKFQAIVNGEMAGK